MHAFFHAQQPQARAGCGPFQRLFYVKAFAVVCNDDLNIRLGATCFYAHMPRLGVPGNIGQRFLHNPEAGHLQLSRQPVLQVTDKHAPFKAGLPGLPIHEPAKRRHQPQIVQHRWP